MIHAIIILSNLAFFGWCIWMTKPLERQAWCTYKVIFNYAEQGATNEQR